MFYRFWLYENCLEVTIRIFGDFGPFRLLKVVQNLSFVN
jgi:hypothetical protein